MTTRLVSPNSSSLFAIFFACALPALSVAGCSSAATTPAPLDIGSGDDGGSNDATADGGATGKVPTFEDVPVAAGQTCDAVCKQLADTTQLAITCGPARPGTTSVGTAIYTSNAKTTSEVRIATCSTKVAPDDGVRTLSDQSRCACASPRIVVDGSATTAATASALCEKVGAQCDAKRSWGAKKIGACQARYVSESGQSSFSTTVPSCDRAPDATGRDMSITYKLSSVQCACIVP